jgi:hypothetical protein
VTEKAKLRLGALDGPRAGAVCCLTTALSITDGARRRLCIAAALVALGTSTPVIAQTDIPENARVLFESLAVSPSMQLTDVGWDDNVLRVSKANHPTGDFTATLAPEVQAWLRLPGLRVRGRSEVDFVYFKEFSQFRSVDTDNSARVELLLGRLTPYVGGAWSNTRHRRNFEIDDPVRRVESSWDAGTDVRLTGKTSIGLMTRGAHVDYKGDTVYLDTDLARYLGATARADGARVRYAATPLTTVGADVEQYRNRFALVPERNSDGVRVTSVVEFKPLAQVSGRASFGVATRRFLDGSFPPFRGTVALIDLGYTLLGRTRFAVGARRDLSYSYRADQRDYLQTGVELSVTHQLANAWDVQGTLGRFRLAYGLGDSSGTGGPAGDSLAERGVSYGVDVGYRVGSTRVGFQVGRQARTSDFAAERGYTETRIASSLTYGF